MTSSMELRRRRNKRNRARRKAMMYINLSFFVIIIALLVLGIFNIFSPKTKYREQAVDLYQAGEYEEAAERFEKAFKAHKLFSKKLDADILLYRADCFVKLKEYDAAKTVYKQLMEDYSSYTDKSDLKLKSDLCDNFVLFYGENYEASADDFARAADAEHKELALYAGICYEHLKDYERMKQYYDIYEQAYGADTFLCYKNITYYMNKADYPSALAYVAKAKECGDNAYIREVLHSEILCYQLQNEYETAYNRANEYISRYPEDSEIQELADFLDTRINPDNESVNGFYD